MVMVVEISTKKILQRFEAWDENCIEDAVKWAKENGYTPMQDEITSMGDMIIWVK